MGLEYLKITPEIMLKISSYDQEQQGRLVMAMIAYALAGEEPQFDGVEKFVWPTLKQDIDNCSAHVEKQKANGSRGGRPSKQETQDKPNENPTKPIKTQDKPNESLNTNTNTNTNTNSKKEDDVVSARARATATATAEPVVTFDGSDVTEIIAQRREVEQLIKRYRLTDNDTTMDALLDDVERWGMDAVKQALESASLSDNRGGLSVKYYRTFLGAKARPAPNASACGRSEQQGTNNPFLQMLREEGYGT